VTHEIIPKPISNDSDEFKGESLQRRLLREHRQDLQNSSESFEMGNGISHTETLNPKQLEAMHHASGPLLILAGAGTGKTKVLVSRIVHLIQQNTAMPNEILAVTFTNKAAREMQERVNNLIDASGLTIGTFHSIASRMLRSHVNLLGLPLTQNFTIVDQDDQIRLIKNIAIENNIDVKNYAPKLLHNLISKWKDQGILPGKLSLSDTDTPAKKMAGIIYPKYQSQLQSSNAVDFGDLLLYCNQLLINNQEILEHYQNRFKYILVDEYQDTNAVQYLWARMLASKHKNICCVGDDDQSIYSWRGAEVKNILRFEKDFPNATIIKLEQNYRSSSYILEAASNVIKNNKDRHSKKLWTEQKEGEKIKIISCWNDKEEARFVATEANNLIKSGKYQANQIAVLVRAGFQTRAFEESFISNAMPYQIIGGLRFYERMEIRDLLAYIRLCINNNDNLALERIINVPRRSIGNVTLKKIKDHATDNNISAFAAIKLMLEAGDIKGKTHENLQKLVMLIENAGKKYQLSSALEATKFILEESGYLAVLKEEKTEESRARIENLNEMIRAIDEFDNIYEFIEHSSLVMDNGGLESDFGGTIKIMTLHAAKGLEFNLVFLPGWEEGIFPHQKALNEEGSRGLEEERRIAYVGLTRAREEVYITFAESRRVFHEFVNALPSRFLAEIPDTVCIRSSSTKNLNYLASRHSFSMQTASHPKENIKLDTSGKKPGNRVRHQKFGNGIIVRKNGDTLEIAFEKIGLKTIKEDYVTEI
jgi:DNA helicase-2/ATP-dependent DNA helicase PcrA